MFHYTVKSSAKAFSDFSLNCPESLGKCSLLEVDGIRYEVFRKVLKVVEAPNSTEIILILDKL